VEVVATAVNDKIPAVLLGLDDACLGNVVAHRVDQRVLLVLGVERGDHARREDVVDELEEALLDHVRVGEEEDGLLVLGPQDAVQTLQVLAEERLVVPPRKGDLEEPAVGRKRAEPRERLLAAAADAHEQKVAAWHLQHALQTDNVLQRVLEEHQVHGLELLVVLDQHPLKHLLDVVVALKRLVQPGHRHLLLGLLVLVLVLGARDADGPEVPVEARVL